MDVSSLPEVHGARPGVGRHRETTTLGSLEPAVETVGAPASAAGSAGAARALAGLRRRQWPAAVQELRYPLGVYAATRVAYLLIALLDMAVRTFHGHSWDIMQQAANWDGKWYLLLVNHGYPHFVSHEQTPLGFFPLYPLLMYGVAHVVGSDYHTSGLLVSLVTGAIATVLVGRLAERWFGPQAARRGILFFCLFPGSIVFSMIYTEGLLLALIAGSLLAVEHRRWVTAGLLAGFATAVGPIATAIIPALGLAALLEMRRHGWLNPRGWRALLAPGLAPLGLVGLGAFMWVWTGSPTAVYQAQRYGWHETSTPAAIPRLAETLVEQILGQDKIHPNVDLNNIAGLLGTVFLVWALVLLWRNRRRVPLPAVVWTVGIAVLTLTSNATPPNARMLICAFPVLLVVAAEVSRRGWRWVLVTSFTLTVAMSMVTFVGTGLRP